MKIFHSQREVIIKGMPTTKERYELALPCSVLKKGSTAHFKEGFLEIKLRKNPNSTLSEIDISHQ
jgi:HSP20 family molecular chaperone IbpA